MNLALEGPDPTTLSRRSQRPFAPSVSRVCGQVGEDDAMKRTLGDGIVLVGALLLVAPAHAKKVDLA
jgi:hypothetical protein